MGIDGCIYWPPKNDRRILKYDPHAEQTSLVGDEFGIDLAKWSDGCLAPDGIIYCIPSTASRVLSIDPLEEYASSLKENMKYYRERLGFIFHPSNDMRNETNFDRAVTKFGNKKVLELFEDCMPQADQLTSIRILLFVSDHAIYTTIRSA